MPQPWTCIAVNTGRQPNDVAAGLNLRILLNDKPPPNSCPALGQNGHNNWSMFDPNYAPGPADPRGQDGFPTGDRRILNAYLTTYGAFSHVNGTSGSVPVIGFGHFYVTGWYGQGGGFDNPCTGNGDDPVPNNDTGLIVGTTETSQDISFAEMSRLQQKLADVIGQAPEVKSVVSLVGIPFVLVRLPPHYFDERHPRTWMEDHHPVLRLIGLVFKNAAINGGVRTDNLPATFDAGVDLPPDPTNPIQPYFLPAACAD